MAKIDNVKTLSSATTWDVAVAIKRNNPLPLDGTGVFMNLDDAKRYAKGEKINDNQNGAVAYVGQIVTVINEDLSTSELYQIQNTAGDLLRLASGGDASALEKKLSAEIERSVSVDNILCADLSGLSSKYETFVGTTFPNQVTTLNQTLSVTVIKQDEAEAGYQATYVVKQGEKEVGAKINIPKDKVISSAYMVDVVGNYDSSEPAVLTSFTVTYDSYSETVTETGKPAVFSSIKNAYNGEGGGDGKYLRITVTNDEAAPIYIAMPELVDTYTGGETSTISVGVNANTRTITAVVKNGSIGTDYLANRAVTTEKLGLSSVTEDILATDSVSTDKIINGSVTTDKIEAKAVTTAKIADRTVTNAQIALSTITSDEIADNAITTGKIAPGAVETDDIKDNAVIHSKLAADAVQSTNILSGAVVESKIGTGAVTESKIGSEAVTENKIGTGAVTESKIGSGAVTSGKIADKNITTGKIADKNVTNEKIADNTISLDKLSTDVTTYIDGVGTTAVETAEGYTDAKINGLSGTTTNDDASKTVDVITQANGKVTATFKSIAIAQSQVTNLTTDLGNISANLTGNGEGSVNSRISTVKGEVVGEATDLSTASTVFGAKKYADIVAQAAEANAKSDTNAKIEALKLDKVTVGADKTVSYIEQANGKVSAEAVSIQIDRTQVTNLTTELDYLSTHVKTAEEEIDGLQSISADHENRIGAIESDYVKSTENEAWKNNIGLSAAKTDNLVVTQKDIKGLVGAMHFRGVTTTELSTGSKVIPEGTGWYDQSSGVVPEAGDIVINTTSTKEFVWAGEKWSSSTTGQWYELGQEGIYMTVEAFETWRDGTLENRLSGIEGDITDLENKVSDYSNDWKAAVDLSVANLSARLATDELSISNEITARIAGDSALRETIGTVSGDLDDLEADSILSIKLNGVYFDKQNNLAELQISCINCGGAED